MNGCRGEAGEAAAEAAAAAAETRGRDECSCQSLEQRDPHTLGNHVRTRPLVQVRGGWGCDGIAEM